MTMVATSLMDTPSRVLFEIHDRNGCSMDTDSVTGALQISAERSFVEMERAMSDRNSQAEADTGET
jgi:hypothetical protein